MSKTQGKNSGLLDNLSDSTIAEELDSRLRDLEKNIAVAREFIKLADESYSELRHKWNLLHEEAQSRADKQAPQKDNIIEEKPFRHKAAKPKRTEQTEKVPRDEPENRTPLVPALASSHKGNKSRKAGEELDSVSTETLSDSRQFGLSPTKSQSPKHKKRQRNP